MFTGIVKEIGIVKGVARRADRFLLTIDCVSLAPVAIGDSVAVSGVCLTVVKKHPQGAVFDVIPHTFTTTLIGSLEPGSKVNIETSLRSGEAIGGHFVSGHVDCVGTIRAIERCSGGVSFVVEAPSSFADLIVEKGSIAVDGVSLTVASVTGGRFMLYVIPHTMERTTLGMKRSGERVNIEFDLLGKYALRQRGTEAGRRPLSEDFLREKGFI